MVHRWTLMDGMDHEPSIAGRIGIAISDGRGLIVEMACETDFAARSPHMDRLTSRIFQLALESGAAWPPSPAALQRVIEENTTEFPERAGVRRLERIDAENVIGALSENLRAGVLIGFPASIPRARVEAFLTGTVAALHELPDGLQVVRFAVGGGNRAFS